jgi:hypothetical protein
MRAIAPVAAIAALILTGACSRADEHSASADVKHAGRTAATDFHKLAAEAKVEAHKLAADTRGAAHDVAHQDRHSDDHNS